MNIYMLEYYCTYAVNCVIYCSAVQDEGHGIALIYGGIHMIDELSSVIIIADAPFHLMTIACFIMKQKLWCNR